MKQLLFSLIALSLVFSLVACIGDDDWLESGQTNQTDNIKLQIGFYSDSDSLQVKNLDILLMKDSNTVAYLQDGEGLDCDSTVLRLSNYTSKTVSNIENNPSWITPVLLPNINNACLSYDMINTNSGDSVHYERDIRVSVACNHWEKEKKCKVLFNLSNNQGSSVIPGYTVEDWNVINNDVNL